MEIEVKGQVVEVDDSFKDMSPEQREATVNEIAAMLPPTAEERAAEEKVKSDLYKSPGAMALYGTGLGLVEQALGKPVEKLAAKGMGAQRFIEPATGEPAGWKWGRKTGFGAGLDPTVEGQSTEFQKRKAEGTFKQKPGQIKPIPGKAMTIEKYGQNVERDLAEARAKALAAKANQPGTVYRSPTGVIGKAQSLGGRMLGGAGALGLGAEAYQEGSKAVDLMKAGDIKGAARAGRGALLNAIGSAGSAATFIPHPLAKGIGTAVGMGAPVLNLLLEKAGYKQGGLVHLADGGTPKTKLAKKAVEQIVPLWEKFGYDPKKIASQYPDVLPPVEKIDPKKGTTYPGKQLSQEALAVQKARQAAQKEIDTEKYTPFFDITKRSYVDPANYPMMDKTIDLTMPKKAETLAKHRSIAQGPEPTARLEAAYESGVGSPRAHGFYMMKQLEDEYIKELGPELGRIAFRRDFAEPMAATTGGQTPTANLMMTAMHNYFANKGLPMPSKGYDLPYPVGGNKLQSNIDMSQKLFKTGTLSAADSPKRYNFASNFMGHSDRPTIDEQMMSLFNPKGKGSPDWYGVNEEAVNILAKKRNVDPVNYQEVAWAAAKGYPGQPMIEDVNQMLYRTSRITGDPQEEVLKKFIRRTGPMYGVTGLGALGLEGTGSVNNPD